MKRAWIVIVLSVGLVILGATARAAAELALTVAADLRFAHGLRIYAEQQAAKAHDQADANAKLQQELDHRGGR